MAADPNPSGARPAGRAMGRPPASDGAATRRTLIAAASRQLATVGYDAMTLEEVANAAGITRGAVYGYFPSKRELARAAVLEATPAIEENYAELARDAQGLVDRLRALIRACMNSSLMNPEPVLGFFQLGKLANRDEELAREFRTRTNGIRRMLRGLLAEAEANGELAPGADQAEIVDAVSGIIFAMAAGAAEAPNERVRQQIILGTELLLRDPPWIVRDVRTEHDH